MLWTVILGVLVVKSLGVKGVAAMGLDLNALRAGVKIRDVIGKVWGGGTGWEVVFNAVDN